MKKLNISHFSVFSYCECAIASEYTKIGQNRLHYSISQYGVKRNLEFKNICCATKCFLALCCENWKMTENVNWAFKIYFFVFEHNLFAFKIS